MKCALFLLFSLATVPMAWAHPHVFVDVGLSFEADGEGRIVAVEVTWSYDELFSLLVLSDRELDQDADMVLTEEERAQLLGFDLTDWPEGFEGALFLSVGERKLMLDQPEAVSAGLDGGRIVTRHRRAVEPVAAAEITVQAYDPYYYAALTLDGDLSLPEGCTADILRPDTGAADARVEQLGGFDDEQLFEEVQVGVYYAETLVVRCAGS
jgi:ABC-type uncharacterized transport system substrate-binding protein